MSQGGLLPDALAAVGCAPEDVDLVFLTHLHPDHVGWVAPGTRRRTRACTSCELPGVLDS
jgi:glyoxylase-like metal-dependent hydrolase (beta-lactamase superfamily II)